MATHRPSYFERYQDLSARAAAAPHYLDSTYLDRYARTFRAELLTSRNDILCEDAAFRADRLFMAFLTNYAPRLLAWRGWRVTALQIAEQLAVEPPREPPPEPPAPEPKPQMTPEEWLAGSERGRQWRLTRKRATVEDYKAEVMQDLDMLHEFIADIDSSSPDEDDRDRLINEFKERLFGGEDESSTGVRQL